MNTPTFFILKTETEFRYVGQVNLKLAMVLSQSLEQLGL